MSSDKMWGCGLGFATGDFAHWPSGPQFPSQKCKRVGWSYLRFLPLYNSVTQGKEKVMREDTKSIAGWGPDLKVIRVVSPSSRLLALCPVFLPPLMSNNSYSLSASMSGRTCLKVWIPCLETNCNDEKHWLVQQMHWFHLSVWWVSLP